MVRTGGVQIHAAGRGQAGGCQLQPLVGRGAGGYGQEEQPRHRGEDQPEVRAAGQQEL